MRKPKMTEWLKRYSQDSNKLREGRKAEGDNVKKEMRVTGGRWREKGDGGTHSKQDGLDWHACGPSALSAPYGFLNRSNAQLSFLLPRECCRTGPTGPNVNRNTHTHPQTHTHTHKHTRASAAGRRERGRVGRPRGRGPRGLSLEECCL